MSGSSRMADRRRSPWTGLAAVWAALAMLLGTVTTVLAPASANALPTVTTVSGVTPKLSDTTPRVGQKLSVNAGTWTPSTAVLDYQWYRGSDPIAGATSAAYVVQPVDLGQKLKVRVAGSQPGLAPATKVSAVTSTVARGYLTAKPKPVLNDSTPVVDQKLTVSVGSWAPDPVSLKVQWYKESTKGRTTTLTGATSTSYVVKASDKGYRLKVKVTGSKAGYYSAAVVSAKTGLVKQYSFSSAPKPVVKGEAKPGGTLSVTTGSWTPAPDSFAYQWYRSGKAIADATRTSLVVAEADLGLPITVKVTAVKAGYKTVTVTSAAVTPRGPETDLRVGSFNLSGQNNDSKASGDFEEWSKRMPRVVTQILDRQLDVVGLQEAYQGTTQYIQLRNALNARGGTYEVVDTDKSTSAATRIIYDSQTLEVADHGYFKYANQVSGKTNRYLVWAVFRHKVTGKRFFFANTHLSPNSATVKIREWRELVTMVGKLNTGKLPVITVGDFNTSKFDDETKELLPAMKAAGFGDVMNQQFEVNPPVNPRAEKVVNGWIGSFNKYRRDITSYSYSTKRYKVGNVIDWIFVANSLRVKQWEVVIDYNPSTLRIDGVIPSDHNMVAAVVVL